MSSKIIISKSRIHGKGIIANQDIKKGEIVFIIKGKPVHFVITNKKASLRYPRWVGMSKFSWIDPHEPARFLNHSCSPSCGIKGKVEVVALHDIKKGEEITIDYSITEMDTLWHMKCNCGNNNCRKMIRSIQSLPREIFNKYTPYVPTYFMKVYNRYHNGK